MKGRIENITLKIKYPKATLAKHINQRNINKKMVNHAAIAPHSEGLNIKNHG